MYFGRDTAAPLRLPSRFMLGYSSTSISYSTVCEMSNLEIDYEKEVRPWLVNQKQLKNE